MNPAGHSARDEAERRGWPFPGTSEELIEAELLAETAGDEACGAWLMGERRPALLSVDDLLTEDERRALHADLAEMSRQRRRAADLARDWPMP